MGLRMKNFNILGVQIDGGIATMYNLNDGYTINR